MDSRGAVTNPPSGSLIDTGLVAKEGSDSEFDFYLIPQTTTQGCITPTHFYVPLNESPLTKDDLTKFTYDLCHYYYNWAGAIKVPAPCMYAHTLAELRMHLSKNAPKETANNLCDKLYFL